MLRKLIKVHVKFNKHPILHKIYLFIIEGALNRERKPLMYKSGHSNWIGILK